MSGPAVKNTTMKIMHIASGDKWAGAEVQVWTLCAELVKQGHQVSAILLNPGRLAEQLAKVGVITTVLSENQFNFAKLLKKIKLELRRTQPDVVHTHRQKENILGSLANRLTINTKCFRTVHGAPEFAPSAKQRVQITLDRYCGRYLQHGVISVADELTQKLTKMYPASHIHTIANGISAKAVQQDAASQQVNALPENVRHIGFVGRIEPVKRVDLFLQTAKLLLSENKHNVHFHLFGDGRLKPDFEKWVQAENLEQHITFYGHTDSIRGWIKQMDMLLMPSDHEGLPMTALESLALGTPMVAHATGGLVPLLNAAHCDGLVSNHTAQAYANKVNQMLSSPGQVVLPGEYDAAHNAQNILALYRQ